MLPRRGEDEFLTPQFVESSIPSVEAARQLDMPPIRVTVTVTVTVRDIDVPPMAKAFLHEHAPDVCLVTKLVVCLDELK